MESTSQEDLIRRRAYELWEREGSPDGRADEFWEQAAASVAGESPAAGEANAPGEPAEPKETAGAGTNGKNGAADPAAEASLGRS